MADRDLDKLIGWLHVALALGFGLKGASILKGGGTTPVVQEATKRADLGRLGPEARAMKRAGGVIKTAKTVAVKDIDERISYIKRRIKEDSLKPIIRERTLAVLTRKCGQKGDQKWCVPPKDWEAEVKAIYRAVQDVNSDVALRYTRDHISVDQFQAADKSIRLRGGDCDCGTILLGSMLRSVGYPLKMRVIQDSNSSTWSHIYLLVGLPPTSPKKWISLDWSVYPFKPAGWEAPGAKDVALTGAPSGIVTRLRDFGV